MKNPSGLCFCGCGERTPLARWARRGFKVGEPLCYIHGHATRRVGPEYLPEDRGFESPCWIWQGYVDARHGYGRKAVLGTRNVRGAHTIYFEARYGPLPDGYELHHRCEVRACVNPDHLEATTRREHMFVEGRRPFGNPHAKVREAA